MHFELFSRWASIACKCCSSHPDQDRRRRVCRIRQLVKAGRCQPGIHQCSCPAHCSLVSRFYLDQLKAVTDIQAPFAASETLLRPVSTLVYVSLVIGRPKLIRQILCALAPNKSAAIIRLTPRALLTGIIATLSTACVAGEFRYKLESRLTERHPR